MELLRPLRSGWEVDRTIVLEEDKLVLIRFGEGGSEAVTILDSVFYAIEDVVKNMVEMYSVNISQVKDFTEMYELYDPCSVMIFYQNRRLLVDHGSGDNNKIITPIHHKQGWIDLIEVAYIGAKKGKGLVNAPKSFT